MVTIVLGKTCHDVTRLRGKENIFTNLERLIFMIVSTFTRQGTAVVDFSIPVFISLLFISFILLAQYEFYLAGNLLAPPGYEPFRTLPQSFDNGYTLVYSDVGNNDARFSVGFLLRDEFQRNKWGKFDEKRPIAIPHYWKNHTYFITKNKPKTVMLLNQNLMYFLHHLQNYLLNGQYQCFLVKDITFLTWHFSTVRSAFNSDIIQIIQNLDEAGLPHLWEKQLVNFVKLRAMKWPSLKAASPYISYNTMSSFFGVTVIVYCLIGIVILLEVGSIRTEMMMEFLSNWCNKLDRACKFWRNMIKPTQSRVINVQQ